MGKGKEFSSAEDTDTDAEDRTVDEPFLETRAIEALKIESVYWGDSEDDDVKTTKTDDKELDSFDSELDNADIWKCIRLVARNKFYRY